MPCRVSLATELLHTEAIYSGTLTAADLKAAAGEIMALMQERGTTRLLADCTDIKGGHSVFDLYELADWIKAHAPHLREAVVLPAIDLAADPVRFWKPPCRNRGIAVRIFNDRDAALRWLHDPTGH